MSFDWIMSDQLREACKLFFEHTHSPSCRYGQRLILDPENCTRCMAERDMRAALADSATKDGGGVLDAQTVERGVEPGTHGGAGTDRETRPLNTADAPRKRIPVTVTQLSAAEIVAAKTGDTWLMSIGGHKVWTGIDNCALEWQARLIGAALESALAAHAKQEG